MPDMLSLRPRTRPGRGEIGDGALRILSTSIEWTAAVLPAHMPLTLPHFGQAGLADKRFTRVMGMGSYPHTHAWEHFGQVAHFSIMSARVSCQPRSPLVFWLSRSRSQQFIFHQKVA